MIWLGLILGIAIGAAGYWLYDKYAAKAKAEVVKIKQAV